MRDITFDLAIRVSNEMDKLGSFSYGDYFLQALPMARGAIDDMLKGSTTLMSADERESLAFDAVGVAYQQII